MRTLRGVLVKDVRKRINRVGRRVKIDVFERMFFLSGPFNLLHLKNYQIQNDTGRGQINRPLKTAQVFYYPAGQEFSSSEKAG